MDSWKTCRYVSPLGPMTMAWDGEALKGLWFDGQAHFGAGLTGQEREEEGALTRQIAAWLDRFFAGEAPGTPGFPVAPEGTPFQREVWALLREIPRGQVVTYGQLARALEAKCGRRTSARAVGGAVGRNPVSLVIPCHRVVGAGGKLTGYAGGTERKAALLRLEGWLPGCDQGDAFSHAIF